jgi:uncharacterized protein YjbJ (UPF0337 family)
MDREEIKGKARKAKGIAKDKAGEVLNDPDLEAQGEVDRATGAAQETFGRTRRKVREGIEDVADRMDDE